MTITQVPAKPSHWGLSTWPYGIPGRLGFKVDTIVIHWLDTNLATADRIFQGNTTPERMVSSHFGVEDDQVHQYVSVNNVAWQAGNWLINLTSIGIEHSAEPGRDASDMTYETSANLICSICHQLGLVPSRKLLKKHSEIVATQCPGTIDLDRLAARAVALWNMSSVDQPVSPPTPDAQVTVAHIEATPVSQPVVVPITFTVTISVPVGRIRLEPNTTSKIMAEYTKGTSFDCIDTVQGESVNGESRWYKSKIHGYYINASICTHN